MLDRHPEEIWGQTYADAWIERAEAEGTVPGADVYRQYLDRLDIGPHHAVLDLGVGTGRLLPELLRRGGRVCGMDISTVMMSRVRERLGRQAPLVNGDAQCLPFADGSFDRIVAWAMWENVPDQRRALSEVARVLRPGGRLLFTSKSLMNPRSLQLAWRRVQQGLVRRLWRWACRRPAVVRVLPRWLRGKCERVAARTEVPQYPTLWPTFARAARRLGLSVTLLDKFASGTLCDEVRLPNRTHFHQQFVAVLEKRL